MVFGLGSLPCTSYRAPEQSEDGLNFPEDSFGNTTVFSNSLIRWRGSWMEKAAAIRGTYTSMNSYMSIVAWKAIRRMGHT